MNITNNNSVNFEAKISNQVWTQLNRQTREYRVPRQLREQVSSKIKSVSGWGSEDTRVIICKNSNSNYALGLSIPLGSGCYGTWAIEHLSGKTELSQFLNLTEKHIDNTVSTIKFLYKKYGYSVFDRAK